MSLSWRKTIVWVVTAIVGTVLMLWWFGGLPEKLRSFQGKEFIEDLNLPEIKMPDLPGLSEKELEELKQNLEQIEENAE